MAQCQVCKTSGFNMKRCKECNSSWCLECAQKGRGHYPKVGSVINKCPYCGKLDKIEVMK